MQCSIRTESDHNCGKIQMKTINSYKNPYKKEPNLDNIVDQLASRLQDIKDQEGPQVGMPTCSIEQAEAVRRYYAAFPALKKGKESPLQYYLPPPAWCRKTAPDDKMQSELSMSKDWNSKSKKFPTGKERRNSYHGQKKNGKKRCNGYSRSFESKENLPEWVTHEGIWDMESQDPVREFIRAIALDEGYGTCENTLADDGAAPRGGGVAPRAVPDWDDGLRLDADWALADEPPRDLQPPDLELYAKFEAKFDRSLEALWARDQNTPDDDYQELPIDFAELLASPSDCAFDAPPSRGTALADAVWARAPPSPPLHDRLRPLHLASPPPRAPLAADTFAPLDGDELFAALATVAASVRSLAAINHSRDASGFAEVPPRRRAAGPPAPPSPPPPPPRAPARDEEDLLTSARTHFRPIRREADAEAARYADGDTFDIRGELEPVRFRRSESGGEYLGAGAARVRYLEYRAEERERGIDYGRLALTAAQREAEGAAALPLRFPLLQRDAAAQTDGWAACDECAGAAKKMRPDAGIWSEPRACRACAPPPAAPAAPPPPDELSRDWEELLADISAAHAHYAAAADDAADAWGGGCAGDAAAGADRKRRHSAALRCARHCAHPHARFLPCCALDRPLTR